MEDRRLLLGRRAAQSRKDHRARTDHHERSPETVGQKRRRASATGTGRERTAFSIITWNVDSLRALFVNDDGQSLHNILTSRKPVLLCLLEHKLQDSHHEDSNRVRAQLEALADSHGYDATWTFSPRAGRDGLVTLARRDAAMIVTPPSEPKQLLHDACLAERRLLYVELEASRALRVRAKQRPRWPIGVPIESMGAERASVSQFARWQEASALSGRSERCAQSCLGLLGHDG